MIIPIYVIFNILGFGFLLAAFSIGLFRSYLPHGKGISVVLFWLSLLCFLILSYSSYTIETVGCDGAGCKTDVKSYEYLVWFYLFFAILNLVMMIVYSILSFGDVFKMANPNL
jgi:hypothetical protein